MATEREARPGKKVLPEFVKLRLVGQRVAGRVKKFDKNTDGEFLVFEPVYVRAGDKEPWHRYGSAAVGLSADLARKVDTSADVGKFLVFHFHDTEATKRASMKKLYKVYDLDASEIASLEARAIDKQKERDDVIERSRGSVVPLLLPDK